MKRLLLGVLVLATATLSGNAQAPSCPTTAPVLVYPGLSASNVPREANNSVTLKWNAVPNATQYDIYFGPEGTGCSSNPRSSSTNQFSPPSSEIVDGASYEWRVVPRADSCSPGPTSLCRKFTMNICPSGPPTLVSPANNSTVAPGNVTLSWNAVANAGFYEVFVSTGGGTPQLVAVTTATSRTITTDPGQTINWAVRAAKTGCNGFTSSTFTFNTTCPTISATPATPADNATFNDTASILFTWGSVDGASSYSLYRSQDNGQTWTPFAENLTSRNHTATFPIGSWRWRVRANFSGNCQPIDSISRAFNVISSSCTNNSPTLITPADGTSHTLPVIFTWASPAAAGKTFLIFVSGPNGTQQVGQTTNNSFTLTTLDPGTYQWWVVEKLTNCPDVPSVRRTITINKRECLNETLTVNSPANNATVPSPVFFSWNSITNATAYRLWGAQDGGAAVLLARVTTTSTSVSLPSGSFKFKIEALRDDCPSILSAEGSFTIPAATNCTTNIPPTLGTPSFADEPATGRKSVVLPWIAQTRAVLYRVFVARDGQPFEDVGATRDGSQVEVTLGTGNYRWYVQAFFSNCPPLNSDVGTFTIEETVPRCSTEKPVLAEPVNGSTVAKLRFRVTEVTTSGRQVRYRFFAVIDRTNAEPEVVFLGASTSPEFEPSFQPPPGTYQAFVEKTVDQCPPMVSDRVTFTIARAQNCNTTAPTLVFPANGATITQGEVDFRWNPVPQANAKYVLVLQVNDGALTPVGTTAETHLLRRVPPGRIRWLVIALTDGCDPVTSLPFLINVEALPVCDVPPPIALHPHGVEEASDLGVGFAWTRVPGATRYHLFAWPEGEEPAEVASTESTRALVKLAPGTYNWNVAAEIPNCGTLKSAISEFTVIEALPCGTPGKPQAHVAGRTLSGSPYVVRWTSLARVKTYELQQSSSPDFSNAETFLVNDTQYTATQTIPTGVAQFHYRVRGLSDCNDESGPFSDYVTITIVGQQTNNASVEVGGTGDIQQKMFIPGSSTPSTFSIAFDKPWAKAEPSSGPLPPEGVTVLVTSDRNRLRLGGNAATARVTIDPVASSGKLQAHGSTLAIPINVSLVTPVTPSGKSGPSPDSLIFAAVGHAPGQNGSFFESDVRVANLSAQTMKYQLLYTPSGTEGTTTGSSTTIEIQPNQTLALDDVLSSVFGLGDLSGALGMLEVRPLTTATTSSGGFFSTVTSTAQQLMTLGSSRTYNFTPTGTFGQFIPATPYSKFVSSGKILSLQHVSQSTAMRANFGFLEASGQAVELAMRVYNTLNQLVGTIPISLRASEHQQIGLLLAANGITDLEDGRAEVEVTSGNGKVTAYVSEVDNLTNDPFVVSATEKGTPNTNRYIVPGMAHKDLGFAFWVSDMRIYNSGTTQVPATLTFYAEADPANSVSKQVTLDPGEIEVLNDVIQNLFNLPNGSGGSIVVTTPTNAPLAVTARTYNRTTSGTYGQFIPGVTVAESIGVGARALQILQVEHSTRFRTNIVLNETTGNPATVEVALIQPDSIVTPFVTYSLAGNEYRQFSAGEFGLGDSIYNARVTVKVIGGTGKVTASGSSLDMSTNDGTYIPAQQ